MYKTIFLAIALLVFEGGDKKIVFTSPLDIPLSLSANFGELRPGHFHSGLDFKTNGVNGKKVYSVADGYIYRISVSPGGFGNALYIRHPNGISSVYGHLNRFSPEIESYVTGKQYNRESYTVNLFPDRQLFPVSAGELIAYSGNSGSSFGPHLHFELRNSANENPINPLDYFELEDNIRPLIKKLALYPLGRSSEINGKREVQRFDLMGSNGIYRISSNRVMELAGCFGVGISTYDFINNSWNKCGVKTIRLMLDGETVYKHTIEEFSFDQTRYINSHIDFAEYQRSGTYYQETFVEPNNFLAIYDTLVNNGVLCLPDSNIHEIKIDVIDFADNISSLVFSAKRADFSDNKIAENHFDTIMPFNKANSFIREDVRLEIPSDAFYDTVYFSYSKLPSTRSLLSDIHVIHRDEIPVHKSFTLSILPVAGSEKLLGKAGIVSISGKDTVFIGGEIDEGFISTSLRQFGKFAIAADTLAPVIKALNFSDGENIKGRDELRLEIDDDFSGIASYEGFIDGKWALFEWDAKNKLIRYLFRKGNLEKDTNHSLVLTVTDNRGNSADYAAEFHW
ncbi:MAG: M23 family metallopeptidase [Marinilabiliaceae bacterium]|jgi:hypothetical protein|nr:M23 family metallopeptidase [Marinilabiliaceae bacterium]